MEKRRGHIDAAFARVNGHRLDLVNPSVVIPQTDQLNLYSHWGADVHASRMGLFYELATVGLRGGVLYDNNRRFSRDSSYQPSRPDIVVGHGREDPLLLECKACHSGHSWILREEQLRRYLQTQLNLPQSQTSFVIYRHDLKDIRSYKGSQDDLYAELAKGTLFSLELPLSVLLGIVSSARPDGEKVGKDQAAPISRRADHKDYQPAQRVSSSFLNRLLHNPSDALTEAGVDPNAYIIDTYRFPERLQLLAASNGNPVGYHEIVPFPVVAIRDKDHEAWVQNLRSRCADLADKLGRKSSFPGDSPLFLPEFDGCSDAPESVPETETFSEEKVDAPF